ncbi:hypothetical protein PENTCL1PPCAC_3879, partial [Pristionchus entomophagus]
FYLNEPIRALCLTEAEQAISALLACFYDDVPKLSPSGRRIHSAVKEKLIRCLAEVCRRSIATRGVRGQLAVAMQVSRIVSLFPCITDLSIRASDSLEVCEI